MTWKVRHEGSPQHMEQPLEEIQQGLIDGVWEPTDEVMGPDDSEWKHIESHPALAELAADIEAPPPRHYDDETRLDMNALIDVCLVLLVFFMLTTTVAALQTRLEAPGIEKDDKKNKIKVVTKQQVEAQMISCEARMEGGKPVIRVEGDPVDPNQLTRKFRQFVRATSKTSLLLQHDGEVPHEVVVQVLDAAKGAGMDRVQLVVPSAR
jgi:biopolymer transport protein ExbD